MDLSGFVDIKSKKPKEINDEKLQINVDKIKKDFSTKEIERYLPWFLKYKIEKLQDLIQTSEIKQITEFITKFKKGNGILLYGRAGCGKTTTLNLIGKHFGYEIYELNASDNRNKKSIDQSLGDVIKQKSLFGKNKFILIDEIDGIAGREDRGGVGEIAKIIKESPYPIVCTANDGESEKIKSLKKTCKFINFENNAKEILLGIAHKIFKTEKIKYEEKDLAQFIEKRDSIDIRGFINDLQANTISSKFVTDEETLEIRDYKKKIEQLLDRIYFSYPEDSYKGSFNSDINLDDLFLYLEENCPNIYTKKALIEAFNEISKADVFRGRIIRWQHWRFLVYINFYLTFGISASKTTPKRMPYKKNQRILKKWIYSNKFNSLRKRTKAEKKKDMPQSFIEKLAKFYGCSAERCRKRDLYYFAIQYKNSPEFQKEMDNQFKIDEKTKKGLHEL